MIFKWKNEKQNCFTAVENRGFSKRSVMKMQGFHRKDAFCEYRMENLKKIENF